MAATLTSSLIVRLIDQVSKPARQIAGSLLGLNNAAKGGFGARLNAAIEQNNAALDRARGRMLDAVAGFYVLKTAIGAPLKAAADFETALEDIGQKAGIPQDRLAALGNQIRQVARDTNQATLSIAAAVDSLVGRGASEDVALAASSPIGKAATAYRAATDDLAAAAWSAVDNLKVPADQIGTAIDMMAQAGKEGAFELRDMAQYFPTLGASYQALGQSGTGAVADLAAALQIVRKGTGDASSAATNLANVLQKVYSNRTTKGFKDLGVDIRKEMKKAAEAGMTPIEAIAEITNKALDGDLSKLGLIFEDAQVQAGMRSLIQNMDEYRRIRKEALSASGVVDEDFARRLKTAQGAMDRWNATIQNLNISIGTTLVPLLTDLLDKIVPIVDAIGGWVQQNPELARGIVTATAGLIAFKVAMAGLSFVGLLGKGGALSVLALGFNTVGKAVIGARGAIAGGIGLQAALAGMEGGKLTGLDKLVTAVTSLARAVPGFAALQGALAGVGSALGTISLPVVAGIAAVAAAGVLIWKYWDRISSIFSGVAKRLGEELAPAFEAAAPHIENLKKAGEAIGDGFKWAFDKLKEFGDWIGSFFSQEVLTEDQKAGFEQAGYDIADRMINAVKAKIAELIECFKSLPSRILAAVGTIDLGSLIKANMPAWMGGGPVTAPVQGHGGQTLYPVGQAPTGHRAKGGPVHRGSSFLVGEKEPELFTPKTGGRITPLSKLGGGVTFGDIIIQGATNPEETAQRVRQAIRDEINNLVRGAHLDMGARA